MPLSGGIHIMHVDSLTKPANFRIPLFCAVTLLFWMSMYTSVPIMAPYVESLGGSGPVLMGVIGDWFQLSQGFLVLGILGCLTAILSQWLIRSGLKKNPEGFFFADDV
jgi:hypothetical protein